MVYDTKMNEWSGLGEWSGSDQLSHYQENEKYGIWLGDHFIYYVSATTSEPVIATLVKKVKKKEKKTHAATPPTP